MLRRKVFPVYEPKPFHDYGRGLPFKSSLMLIGKLFDTTVKATIKKGKSCSISEKYDDRAM
jgi:hypothetical protein